MGYQPVQLDAGGRWPADVAVWHVTLPAAEADIDRYALDEAELERAARYRQPADRLRYMTTRAALREVLGGWLGVEPASLRFAVTRRGKPELAGVSRGLSFNVSHAGQHALIAISDARIVGIDVERVDPTLDWQELADIVCTTEERHVLQTGPATLQRERFFRCWTAKEALLKALGVGIAEGLRALVVNPAGSGSQRPVVAENELFAGAAELHYHWLTDIPAHVGCVAFGRTHDAQAASREAAGA